MTRIERIRADFLFLKSALIRKIRAIRVLLVHYE